GRVYPIGRDGRGFVDREGGRLADACPGLLRVNMGCAAVVAAVAVLGEPGGRAGLPADLGGNGADIRDQGARLVACRLVACQEGNRDAELAGEEQPGADLADGDAVDPHLLHEHGPAVAQVTAIRVRFRVVARHEHQVVRLVDAERVPYRPAG